MRRSSKVFQQGNVLVTIRAVGFRELSNVCDGLLYCGGVEVGGGGGTASPNKRL